MQCISRILRDMKPVSHFNDLNLGDAVDETWIIYDGECPFCSRFVEWQRLKESVGTVNLHDARDENGLVKALWKAGFDLNEGMILIFGGHVYHGDECIHRLALLSSGSGWFNKLNAWIFRSPGVSSYTYPILRAGRNLTLRLLGRRKIKVNEI